MAVDPQYISALRNKVVTLNELGRYEEALVTLDKTIEIDPGDPDALNLKSEIEKLVNK